MEKDKLVKVTVEQQFGRAAEKYVTSESHAKGDDLSLLIEWLCPQVNWIVLDVATGGGHVAKTIAPHVNTVFATDLTKPMLEAARHHITAEGIQNINYILADAEALPFLDNTFHAATCRIAPHHFPNQNQFVYDIFRVLKPGGHFLLIDNVSPEDEKLADYLNTFERLRDNSHVRCASMTEWKMMLKKSGFHIKKSRARKKTVQFSAWLTRMAQSAEQMNRVEHYIQSGEPWIQDYFNVQIQNGNVQSLDIDEWMVHCVKA